MDRRWLESRARLWNDGEEAVWDLGRLMVVHTVVEVGGSMVGWWWRRVTEM